MTGAYVILPVYNAGLIVPKDSSPAGSLEGSGFMYSENRGASREPSLSMLKKAGVVCKLEIAGNARPCRANPG